MSRRVKNNGIRAEDSFANYLPDLDKRREGPKGSYAPRSTYHYLATRHARPASAKGSRQRSHPTLSLRSSFGAVLLASIADLRFDNCAQPTRLLHPRLPPKPQHP